MLRMLQRAQQPKTLIRVDPPADLGMVRPRPAETELPLWTVAYWRRLLAADRSAVTMADDSGGTKAMREQLQRSLHTVLVRYRKITNAAELNFPGMTVLAEMVHQGLELARLLHSELTTDSSSTHGAPQPDAIRAGLAEVEYLFRHAESSIRRLHEMQRLTARFSDMADEILCRPSPNAAVIVSFVRQIEQDCQTAGWGSDWIGPPGMSFRQAIRPLRYRNESYVAVNGLLTARLLLMSLGRSWPYRSHVTALAAAALLQDVGLLVTERRFDCDVKEFQENHRDIYRRHPELGAALIAGVKGLPLQTHHMILQHHEQIDMGGFPYRPVSDRLNCHARVLAIVSRFVELLETTTCDVETPLRRPGRADLVRAVARQLVQESDRGEWDAELTRRFLISLIPEFNNVDLSGELSRDSFPDDGLTADMLETADWLTSEDHRHDQPHPEPKVPTETDVSGSYRPIRRGGRTRWIARDSTS